MRLWLGTQPGKSDGSANAALSWMKPADVQTAEHNVRLGRNHDAEDSCYEAIFYR